MRKRNVLVWVSVISLSFSVGFITNLNDNYFEISKNLDIFGKLYREINSLYVDDTDPTALMNTGIEAMLNSLDPYTNFISEKEIDDFKFMSTGQYGGIGAMIGRRKGRIVVLEPYKGYPADQAGLKAGDELIMVNNDKLDGRKMEIVDVRNLLRGQRGTEIALQIRRPGIKNPLSFSIKRDRITVKNVPYFGMVTNDIGYISLVSFTQDAGREVEMATQSLLEKNKDLKGIILDLRSNPGGRLDEAVKVANVFVDQNEKIVETRGRMDGSYRVHTAQRLPINTQIPIAILVNQKSASASEIVAGSIQDLDRGIIVGEQSFGKGLVQNIRPLSYNTQLKVTTAKYYTPSGRCIQAINYEKNEKTEKGTRIPDSLRSSFKTRNGRMVLDGRGIQPDIEVEHEGTKDITQALVNEGLIFDFATEFVLRNERIGKLQSFSITESIYKDFIDFVSNSNFSYETPADRQFSKLKEAVENESYYDRLSADLKTLERRMAQQKDLDLSKHKKEISILLHKEIVKRYFYKEGQIEASIQGDKDIDAAAKALSNPSRYKQILNLPQ